MKKIIFKIEMKQKDWDKMKDELYAADILDEALIEEMMRDNEKDEEVIKALFYTWGVHSVDTIDYRDKVKITKEEG